MKKRGQSTIFIILGIVVVIVVVLLVVSRGGVIPGGRLTSAQVEPIREFVEECVEEQVISDLVLLRRWGGYFGQSEDYYYNLRMYAASPVNYLVTVHTAYNPNRYRDASILESDIGDHVETKLQNECSLDSFRRNFDIEEGFSNLKADVSIKDNAIEVSVIYPIKVSRGDVTLDLDTFQVNVEDDFGKVYKVAVWEITNFEAENLGRAGAEIAFNIGEFVNRNPEFGGSGEDMFFGEITIDPLDNGYEHIYYIRTVDDARAGREFFIFASRWRNPVT